MRHVERDWGRDLTWQTIDVDNASLQDLLQAPVLVISGRNALRLRPEVSDQLKQYIDNGGTLLFEAEAGDGCGEATGFERSVTRALRKLVRRGVARTIAAEPSGLVCRTQSRSGGDRARLLGLWHASLLSHIDFLCAAKSLLPLGDG